MSAKVFGLLQIVEYVMKKRKAKNQAKSVEHQIARTLEIGTSDSQKQNLIMGLIEDIKSQSKKRQIVSFSAFGLVVVASYVLKSKGIELPIDPLIIEILTHLLSLGVEQ